jgi:hypothetical protein
MRCTEPPKKLLAFTGSRFCQSYQILSTICHRAQQALCHVFLLRTLIVTYGMMHKEKWLYTVHNVNAGESSHRKGT